ncbi:E3 ubiquitin-protein ligase TRIM21-like [Chaetodon trifascialis]|uniref:E3 ubiquitin-protein ligase TRIM21-like n=1 Tax=Chaetodon trifascialis TaxID=109706 RepID=UPI0039925210
MSLQVCGCCGWSKVTSYHGLRTHQGKMGCTPKGMRIPESEQFRVNSYSPKFTFIGPPIKIEEPFRDVFTPSVRPAVERNMWTSLREESHKDIGLINSTPFRKEPLTVLSLSQSLSSQVNPAVTNTNKSLFETPQQSHQTATKARRALDFSIAAPQVPQLVFDPPTTTVQEAAVRQNEEEKEAEKRIKARKDRIRADLLQKIQMREQKVAEVRSSAKACKGSLDAEWVEINNVFSEVMRVVEDARQKALRPLEERRDRVKREEQDLLQKLQKEINKLKWTIDELDKNPDLQVSPPAGLDESQDWKKVTVDSSFSLGSLKTETSNMMERILQKLDKLSSVDLKRIPTFAVDVKLDPTTAHQCLVLSPDGKKVRDGGQTQRVPDAPGRFDMFGSVLGLNRLTFRKSYWEVEVGNKTGWDLGVARRNANRKGKLSLTPDNGYWVTVHYEDEKYAALTAPAVSLSLTAKPQKVGVFVDYEEGLVSFYDVKTQTHIYSFTKCSFNDELLPYFSPHLKANGKNLDPLIISDVMKRK